MHDIKFIREHPDVFDAGMKKRGLAPQAAAILEKDSTHKTVLQKMQSVQAERNALSKEIGKIKGQGGDATEIMEKVAALKESQHDLEAKEKATAEDLKASLLDLPNILHVDVPDGEDEDDNREERVWGEIPAFDFDPKMHDDLGVDLGLMDFERAAKVAGARFAYLKGDLAKLELALGQFMLDVQTNEHDYMHVAPPLLVNETALHGTGHLPKFEEDQFKTTDGYYLIPTSEAALSTYHMGELLSANDLPVRMAAFTPCFRSEAGSAGRDTRGMIRQHQFNKVEMISLVKEEEADEELERKIGCAEEILKRLELPYRVMTLCAGDTGFWSDKTYDIEVWLPGQDAYREISSCSRTGTFQARRMNTRYREEGSKESKFPVILNGSGLAVGRCLVAVMENYQQADGSILIPKALQKYMQIDVISANS